MNTSKNVSSDGTVTMEIEIPVEETGSEFTDVLKKFQREVNVPGFRPGKVPMNLVKKRWGRDILSEKAEELARKYLVDALKQEKLDPGGQITIDLIEYGEDKQLKYKVSFPLRPEVELTQYKGLRVLINDAEITDDDVNEQIEAYRKKFATLRSIDDPATAEARLTLKVQEVDPSGLPLIGRKTRDEVIELGLDALGIGSDEQLIGIKAEEKRVIIVQNEHDSISSAPHQSAIITPDQAAGKSDSSNQVHLLVEAVKVEVQELPEINDDFVKMVNEKLSSVEELHNWIKFNMLGYIETIKLRQIEKGIVDRLIEDNPFTISESFMNSTLDGLLEDIDIEKDEDRKSFIEEHRREAERDLRWVMLRDKIALTEDIKVSDEDFENELNRISEQTGDTPDEVKKKLEKDDAINRLKRNMYELRIIEFLKAEAEVEKRMMPLDDFLKNAVSAQ
ncbi:trigger factor [bacterium]|nr:trigger factor [bacterium]